MKNTTLKILTTILSTSAVMMMTGCSTEGIPSDSQLVGSGTPPTVTLPNNPATPGTPTAPNNPGTPAPPSAPQTDFFDMGGLITYFIPADLSMGADMSDGKVLLPESGEYASTVQLCTSSSLSDMETLLRTNYTLVKRGEQSISDPYPYTIGEYDLTVDPAKQPAVIAGDIGGLFSTGILPSVTPIANAPEETDYRLFLFNGEFQGQRVCISALVPDNLYSTLEPKIFDSLIAARVTEIGSILKTGTQTFTVAAAKQRADFLFVVDDSGSMSEEQTAIATAASNFTAEMSTSGLAYRSAIITTGYNAEQLSGAANSILRDVGIIENNDTLLEQKLVAGTSGSATETGIWNAERVLQSTAEGDATDGTVTTLGMPQNGATLSVIILSDEPSQYTSRSGGIVFDPLSNMFIDRNITVYSIVDADNSKGYGGAGQYDDLSTATGGITADIDQSDFADIMRKIAQDAGGVASAYTLDYFAIAIFNVSVNGSTIPFDAVNGWTYVQRSKSIVFHGTYVPTAGDTVQVNYLYVQ